MIRHLLDLTRRYLSSSQYFNSKNLKKLRQPPSDDPNANNPPSSSAPSQQGEGDSKISYTNYLLSLLKTPEIIEEVLLTPQQFREEFGYDDITKDGSPALSDIGLRNNQAYEKIFRECVAKSHLSFAPEVHGIYAPQMAKEKSQTRDNKPTSQMSQRETYYHNLNIQDQKEAEKIIAQHQKTSLVDQNIHPQLQQEFKKIMDEQFRMYFKSQKVKENTNKILLFQASNRSSEELYLFKLKVESILFTIKNEKINNKSFSTQQQLFFQIAKHKFLQESALNHRLQFLQKETKTRKTQNPLDKVIKLLYKQKVDQLLKLLKSESKRKYKMSPADVDALFMKEHLPGELARRLELAFLLLSRIEKSNGLSLADTPAWMLKAAHRLRLHPNTPAHTSLLQIVALLPSLQWYFDLTSASYLQLLCAIHFHTHNLNHFLTLLPSKLRLAQIEKQWLLYRADYAKAPFTANEFLIERYKTAMENKNIHECVKCVYVGAMADYQDLFIHFLTHQHKVFQAIEVEQVAHYIISLALNSPSLHSRLLRHKHNMVNRIDDSDKKQHAEKEVTRKIEQEMNEREQKVNEMEQEVKEEIHTDIPSMVDYTEKEIVFHVEENGGKGPRVIQGLLNAYEYDQMEIEEQVKSLIKRGQYRRAIDQFEARLLRPYALQRWRLNLESVLEQYVAEKIRRNEKYTPFDEEKKNKLINQLKDEQILSFYERNKSYTLEYAEYLPQEKFSYWEAVWGREENEYLLSSRAKGMLTKMVQKAPQKYAFQLQEWIKSIPIDMKPIRHSYQLEKQLIRFKNEMKAIMFDLYSHSDIDLNTRINKVQENMSQEVKDVLRAFNLHSFDFTKIDHNLDKALSRQNGGESKVTRLTGLLTFSSIPSFNRRFNMMLAVNCRLMGPQDLTRGMKVEETKTEWDFELLRSLYFQKPGYFKDAERECRLERQPMVEKMLLWGVANEEPLAIYLGEKLAMLTNQTIQHAVALRVSDYLSYRRMLPQHRLQECKLALSLVGKINRQHIYSPSYDYHHILVRNDFTRSTEELNNEVYRLAALKYMSRFVPETRLKQIQPEFFFLSAQQGPL